MKGAVRGLLGALMLTLGLAGAQGFSGPDESRAVRQAEALAFTQAVCGASVWLGRLSGCTRKTVPGSFSPAARSASGPYFAAGVLHGSFTRPGVREALVRYCTETEGCPGTTALLRLTPRGWVALGEVPGFALGHCLTFPARGGTDAAVCLGTGERPVQTLAVARWSAGRVAVQNVAAFGFLGHVAPDSAQCRGRWQVDAQGWHDADRDRSGQPDLTLMVALNRYELLEGRCNPSLGAVVQGGARTDLAFHWDGRQLWPTAATRTFVSRYGARP